jgi:MFS family permease
VSSVSARQASVVAARQSRHLSTANVVVGLGALVVVSACIRFAHAFVHPAPWILPDEILYSDLARSLATDGSVAVRGVTTLGWGVVYPALIAPAWVLFDDASSAYRSAQAINAAVMSLAAVPAYLLARVFVSRTRSLVVAVMSVLVPSMAYTGVLLTENAFYPLFVTVLWLMARCLLSPTVLNQLLVVAAIALLSLTRIQGIVLLGVYLVAALLTCFLDRRPGRRRRLGLYAPSIAVVTLLGLVSVATLVSGEGPALGRRSGTFDALRVVEVPQWFLYLVGGLTIYVALVPFAASVVIAWRGFGRDAPEPIRVFGALFVSTVGVMAGFVAVVSASVDVEGSKNLNERYLFYLVPLLFVGLAAWSAGWGGDRHRAIGVAVAAVLLVTIVPVDRLEANATFQSLALMPLLGLPGGLWPQVAACLLAIVCAAAWLKSAVPDAPRVWMTTATWMMVAFGASSISMQNLSSSSTTPFRGQEADWVDDAVPRGASVAVIWRERKDTERPIDPVYPWIMVTEFFNASPSRVFRIGPPTYYENVLPTVAASESAAGVVMIEGAPLRAEFALADCRIPIRGTPVASSPGGVLRLVRTAGVVRIEQGTPCGADGKRRRDEASAR